MNIDWIQCEFKYGDTVGKICSRYEITINLFKQLNPQIINVDWVSAGEMYYLTTSIINRAVYDEDETNINVDEIDPTVSRNFEKIQVAECYCTAQPHPHRHVFERGDTVGKICHEHGLMIEAFRRKNPHIKDIDCVLVGQPYVLFKRDPKIVHEWGSNFLNTTTTLTTSSIGIQYPYTDDNNGIYIDKTYVEELYHKSLEKCKKSKTKIRSSSSFALELSEALFDEEDKKKCCQDRNPQKFEWLENILNIYFPTQFLEDRKIQWKHARENIDAKKRKKFSSTEKCKKRKRSNSQNINQSFETFGFYGSQSNNNSLDESFVFIDL